MDKKFSSPSTGEDCTAAQLIAEIMTTRQFAKKKLEHKFWNKEPWKKHYVKHIVQANALLKIFDATAILLALKRKEGSWQLSLRQQTLIDIVREEQEKINKAKKQAAEFVAPEIKTEVGRIAVGLPKKSKLGKLK